VTIRLRSLELQGFKSFASRSSLVFDAGITAVVGPNGSGKSNLADAFRWVLGEQALRALRGRRTEDILFVGGPGRPPAGFAEVGLSFHVPDPADSLGGLPYREVTVARRAYRSGESDYFVNRERVRWRDAQDTLGRLGLGLDGFALIGQGAVDAALSLRAVERRALIEQAAGIGHFHARLLEAKQHLEQTELNLQQVSALLGELGPQLATLENRVKLAREREALQVEYNRAALRWYAHLLAQPVKQAATTRDQLAELEHQAAALEAQLVDQKSYRSGIEAELVVANDRLARQHSRQRQAQADLSAAQQRLAREVSQLASDEREHAASAAKLKSLHERLNTANEDQSQCAQRLRDEEKRAASAAAHLAAAERIAAADAGRSPVAVQVEAWRAELAQMERRVARAEAASEVKQNAAQSLAEAISRRQAQLSALAETRRAAEARAAEANDATRSARAKLEKLHEAASKISADREAALHRHATAQRTAAEAERTYQELRTRVEALRSVETSGVGYFAGVREVLGAASGKRTGQLTGVVGVVSRLLRVRDEHELAIETALGSHAQDIVVERWADAEAAIVHLRRTGAGRATFLPLDSLRPARVAVPPITPGVIGVASTLVEVDPRCAIIGPFLLGQTLLVENLAVARLVTRACSPSWQIVTLSGEIARPSGTVTGGAPVTSRGLLGRRRELNGAEAQLAEQGTSRDAIARLVADERAHLDGAERALAEHQRHLRQAEEEARAAAATQETARHRSERAGRAHEDEAAEISRLAADLETAQSARASLVATLEELTRKRDCLAAQLRDAEDASRDEEGKRRLNLIQVAERRAELEHARRQLGTLQTDLERAEARACALQESLADETARVSSLASLVERARERQEQAEVRVAALGDDLIACNRAVAAAEAAVEPLRGQQAAATDQIRRLDGELRHLDEARHRAQSERDLALVEREGLTQQLQIDLGEIDPAALEVGQLVVRYLDGTVGSAALEPATDPNRLRERLRTMRQRLTTLPATADVLPEYQACRERLELLESQSVDLQSTSETLRQAIDETTRAMRVRFAEAFYQVSAAFTRRFANLFGGGHASLAWDPAADSQEEGIEIVGQPPGKRPQSLASLSGGERALTAAALLFALIETRPPPFCVLDEVDAALDETNVGRFTDVLRELAARTQFVVVTHNRRTMEAAEAIYGLTLERRCETRILSVRLDRSTAE
jgi:chromosome segregation protein